MAAITLASASSAVVSAPSMERSAFCGSPVAAQGLPALAPVSPRRLVVTAKGGNKKPKVQTKSPLGPSGDLSFRNGLDASGRVAKGKGVYQFTNKYGANVDGYSPIYTPDEWSPNGDVYTGGTTGLALWAVTLGGVLLAGAFLVYSTSALSQ